MALAVGSAMTGGRASALVMGASPPGVTVGTVGIGPVARDEVVVGSGRPQLPVSWLRSRQA